jgi:uncharacterized membrane protein YgdD (TMEM256/DUF423 family)
MNGWGWLRLGAILGFLAVGFGAFGAHGLKERLEELGTTANYNTAAQYHMYHALAMLAVGFVATSRPGTSAQVAGWAFSIGVILFSGSLYALAITGDRWWGRVTPFGGVALLVGWIALAIAAWSPMERA